MKTEPLPLYLAFTMHFYITLQMLHKLFSLPVNCLWRCWTPDAGTNLYIQLLAYWRFFWCVSFEDKHVEFCVTTQLRSLRQCRALVHFSWYWKACISQLTVPISELTVMNCTALHLSSDPPLQAQYELAELTFHKTTRMFINYLFVPAQASCSASSSTGWKAVVKSLFFFFLY